jgi:hypothetical protein
LWFSALLLVTMPLMPSLFKSLVIAFNISFVGTLLSLVIVGAIIIGLIILTIICCSYVFFYVAKFQGNRNILVPFLFETIGLLLYLPVMVFEFSILLADYPMTDSLLIFLIVFFLVLMINGVGIALGYTVSARGRPYCGTDHPTVMVPQDYYAGIDPKTKDVIAQGNAAKIAEITGITQSPGLFPELIKERLHIILWTCKICHSGYIDGFVELKKTEGYTMWLFASQKQNRPLDQDSAPKK